MDKIYVLKDNVVSVSPYYIKKYAENWYMIGRMNNTAKLAHGLL